MTADELLHLPEDGFRHELLRGELLTFPYHDVLHGIVTMRLLLALTNYVDEKKLGRVYPAVGCVIETDPDTVLAPDIAFMLFDEFEVSPDYYSGAPTVSLKCFLYLIIRLKRKIK